MNLPHVRKIWMAALALLTLWGVLAWLSLGRGRDLERLQATRARSEGAQVALQEAARALSDMESGNRAFLLSASTQARAPFETGKKSIQAQYKSLAAFYAADRASLARLKGFKGTLDRWFTLSNPAIRARRAAGDSPSDALLRDLARGEAERARVMEGARGTLLDLRASLGARVQKMRVGEQVQRRAASLLWQATLGFGVFGIGFAALLLARQSRRITASDESLRREIESRRRAERERQILANHNEQILESTNEGIVGLNIKGRITFVNPAGALMLGWEVAELLGKPWHDLAQHSRGDNTRLDKDASPVMATLRDGSARRISDDVFWKRTGRTFPVEYAVSPLFELSPRENEQRQLSGATLTFRDITERKRSEIALLRLASVVESSKDAILSHLLDGTIVSCNASAVKMYGYSARELEGKPLSTLLPPARLDEARLLCEHIARGERIEPYQTDLLAKGGGAIEVAITFYPVLDARGNIMGASSNARPIRRGAVADLPTFDGMRGAKPNQSLADEPSANESLADESTSGEARQEAVGSLG